MRIQTLFEETKGERILAIHLLQGSNLTLQELEVCHLEKNSGFGELYPKKRKSGDQRAQNWGGCLGPEVILGALILH